MTVEIKTPDLGDFEDVPIIEIYVGPGDEIKKDDPLLAIESDKATMEIPASEGGTVARILVSVGDSVSTGQPLLLLEPGNSTETDQPGHQEVEIAENVQNPPPPEPTNQPVPETAAVTSSVEQADHHAGLVVLGSGPGGYTAAFRAADLGLDVILIERYPSLGGVCRNVGCIPSKALLHVARVISESEESSEIGVQFTPPKIDFEKVLSWKNGIVNKLTQGLSGLAGKRKVRVLKGVGEVSAPHMIRLDSGETVSFDQAIIAAGSQAIEIPGFPHDDPRVIDSTGALELDGLPKRLLIIGGGIIGLEMATVYHALGSKITIVEMLDGLMAGADPDLVRPLQKRMKAQYEAIWVSTKVTGMKALKGGIKVTFEGKGHPSTPLMTRCWYVSAGHQMETGLTPTLPA